MRGTRILLPGVVAWLAISACSMAARAPETGVATAVIHNPFNVPLDIYQVFRDGTQVGEAAYRDDPLGTVNARDSLIVSIAAGGQGWRDFFFEADSVGPEHKVAGYSKSMHIAAGSQVRWIVSLPAGLPYPRRYVRGRLPSAAARPPR